MFEQIIKEFQRGDILYGLDAPRDAVCRAIRKSMKEKGLFFKILCFGRKRQDIIIQNQLTNSVVNVSKISHQLHAPGEFYSSDWKIRLRGEATADPKRAIQFKHFLRNHPKWNLEKGITPDQIRSVHQAQYIHWGKTVELDISRLKNAKIRKLAPKNSESNLDIAKEAWTRTSKAGLEFQTKSRNKRIHFILDEIAFDRVIEKKPGDITSAEIRWLYRNRNNPQVANNVVYWLDGVKVMPPWECEPIGSIFSRYLPRSEYPGFNQECKELLVCFNSLNEYINQETETTRL